MEKRKPALVEGIEEEGGATTGRTHAQVLEQTLGHERAHDVLAAGGPPAMPGRKDAERERAAQGEGKLPPSA